MGFVFTMSKILLIYSVMIEQPFVWIHSIWVWSNNNYIGLATPLPHLPLPHGIVIKEETELCDPDTFKTPDSCIFGLLGPFI